MLLVGSIRIPSFGSSQSLREPEGQSALPRVGRGDVRDLHHCSRRLLVPRDALCFESSAERATYIAGILFFLIAMVDVGHIFYWVIKPCAPVSVF